MTIDHAPARICFKGKEGPDGYETPSCGPCNQAVKLPEQVVALYIRMTDTDPGNFSEADLNKLRRGVANNAPECVPHTGLPTNVKRRAMIGRGIRLKPGETYYEAPVAGVPEAVHWHMNLFGRKMLAALYYRETGAILGADHRLIVQWMQHGTPAAALSLTRAHNWFGEMRVGSRSNTDIGRQFVYRYGYHESHGFFGLWMEFGSICFFTVAGPATQLATLKQNDLVEEWRPLASAEPSDSSKKVAD